MKFEIRKFEFFFHKKKSILIQLFKNKMLIFDPKPLTVVDPSLSCSQLEMSTIARSVSANFS